VAPSIESLAFDSFRPFFIRDASATPCFCQQPYSIDPFTTQPQSDNIDSIFDDLEAAHEHVATDFANAVADAFEVGGEAPCWADSMVPRQVLRQDAARRD
jgi:hypothetical protein